MASTGEHGTAGSQASGNMTSAVSSSSASLSSYPTLSSMSRRQCCGRPRSEHSDRLFKKRAKLVFSSVVGLVGLVLVSIASDRWFEAHADFHELISNWQQVPIEDVVVVASTSACPAGTFEIPPDYPDFPGTVDFCDCTHATSPFSGQHGGRIAGPTGPKGICWQNETSAGCDEVSSTSGHRVFWFDSRVCARRWVGGSSLDGFRRPRVWGNESCPAGFFRCGQLTHNPDDEFVCTPHNSSCPLKSLGTGWPLQPTRVDGPQQLPLVKLDTFPDRPCRSVGAGWRGFDDWRKGSSYSCSRGDDRWRAVVDRVEREFYQEVNRPVPDIAQRCSACQGSTSKRTVLSSRAEVDWRYDCPLTRDQVRDTSSRVDRLRDTQVASLVFTVFMFLSISVVFNFWEYGQEDDPNTWKDDTEEQVQCRFLRIYITVGIGCIKMIPLSVAYVAARSLRGEFGLLVDAPPCTSEADTDSTLRFLGEEVRTQAEMNLWIMIFGAVEVVVELVTLYLAWRARRTKDDPDLPDHVEMRDLPDDP